MKSSENHPINNSDDSDSVIYVDEFVVGSYEANQAGRSSKSKKRKLLMVVEATSRNKIKRVYGMKIRNYSHEELEKIFKKHISKGSTVITDGWRGYNKIQDYNIFPSVEMMKKAINPINRMIQQFKSWLRGIHHHASHQHIEAYLNEFCFRINRSQWKETTFHSAILKAISHQPFPKKIIPNAQVFV
jgi:transposase-like protein